MKWIEKTRGIEFELIRHFLARMFDSEMFSARGEWSRIAVSAFALAVPAGMLLLDPPYFHKSIAKTADNLRAVGIADQLAVLTFGFAVTGRLHGPCGIACAATADLRRTVCLGLAAVTGNHAGDGFFACRDGASSIYSAGGFTSFHKDGCQRGVLRSRLPVHLLCNRGNQGLLINTLPTQLFAKVSTYVQGALVAVFFLVPAYGTE